MYYNRQDVKRQAREVIRETRPAPPLVTVVYLLLASFLPYLVAIPLQLQMLTPTHGFRPVSSTEGFTANMTGPGFLTLFLILLLTLVSIVIGAGYSRYVMNVKRGQPSGFHDLFSGFGIAGRALAASLLVVLFILLWLLPAVLVFSLVLGYIISIGSMSLFILFTIVVYSLLLLYLFNRCLRYSLVNFLIWDRPDLSSLACITESKRLMRGRLWSLFVLDLSFLLWNLIPVTIVLFSTYLSTIASSLSVALAVDVLGMLLALVANMWLATYIQVSTVGFYDAGLKDVGGAPRPLDSWENPMPLPTYIPPVDHTPEPPQPIPSPEPDPLPPVEGPPSDEKDIEL